MYTWQDLPEQARDAVTSACGTIRQVASLPGGLTAGLAVRLDTESGTRFLKALPDDASSAQLYQRERLVGATLPESVPAPRLLWSGHTAGWVILLFEHVDEAREIDLSPGSPDLDGVLDLVQVLGEALTPNPGAGVPPVTESVEFLRKRADALLASPPVDLEAADAYRHARTLLELDALAGPTLLHADLHEGNLLASPVGVRVIDWGLSCQGAAWVETALFVPRLILAGNTPIEAEALAEQVPAYKDAPETAVTALSAVWSLFREFVARNGPPGIRASRARAAAAGRAWVQYRTS
ncbi:phosphotransferase family protein [Planobispora rosea]|uniref:phosphotransferase family protein n=1 Tax=Planobispora rosea TaxID=35762 RepID=UPI00159F2C98|nr:aminoglycoside phosphotransferase family protein [Planobispora rosea]